MAQLLTRIGQLGMGIAIAGGVVNSALYNGKLSDLLLTGTACISCIYRELLHQTVMHL